MAYPDPDRDIKERMDDELGRLYGVTDETIQICVNGWGDSLATRRTILYAVSGETHFRYEEDNDD